MDKQLREKFNHNFNTEKYADYIRELENLHPGALDFRNAETPIFVKKDFKHKMLDATEEIINVITSPFFKTITARSIPEKFKMPGEGEHPQFVVFDYGICKNEAGELEPQLIEMQGFPTLFAYQAYHSDITAKYAEVPENYSSYLGGYTREKYIQDLKAIILGGHDPSEVILLEIFPEQQKTRIDFYCTEKLVGIKTVCLTRLKADGTQLYYEDNGKKQNVKRIYNRVIFHDLEKQGDIGRIIDLKKEYDVEWCPHPNWFYRISKFTLPFIDHPFIPETFFLSEITKPVDLSKFVLKPLFSFAGMGVVIDVTQEDIDQVKDPENWILQKKVQYADVIETPNEPAKAEIRLFYFWKEGWKRPIPVHNLVRLSKGKMIGTRYNKDKDWVGGSIAYFEKD